MIRKPAVADMFYPADPMELEKMIKEYMEAVPDTNLLNDLKGVISPHAGYVYSGPIAAFAYKQLSALQKANPETKYTVFILAPSHYEYINASVGNYDEYETPLGNVKVNKKICRGLTEDKGLEFIEAAHLREHSLEVQLPFLMRSLNEFEIVPILLGDADPDRMADILNPYFNEKNNLFVISSDLSHYLPYERANKVDRQSLDIMTSLDQTREQKIDACGIVGIKIIMRLAKINGYQIKLLDYRNSGDTAGDKSGVVGYGALAITK